MPRPVLCAALFFVVAIATLQPARAHAQSVNNAQLATALLSPADVPGFHTYAEEAVTSGADVFQAGYERILEADDLTDTGSASILAQLLVPRSSVTTDAAASSVSNGYAFSRLPETVNLQLTGPLGIGDVDQAAVWEEWDDEDGTWDTFYADSFLVGRLIVAVSYGTHSDAADPTQLPHYAQLQYTKLFATAALPQGLLTPSAVASAPPASSASASTDTPPSYTPPSYSQPATSTDPNAPTPMCPNGFIPYPGNGRGPTLCKDGLCSHSAGRGTCSGHGGEARVIRGRYGPLYSEDVWQVA